MYAKRTVIVSASAAGMLATFLPWVSLGGIISAAGTQGDGWITLALFVVTLLVALVGNRANPVSTGGRCAITLIALLAAIAGLYDFSSIHDMNGGAVVGAGLYLVLAAAVVVIATASIGDHILPMLISLIVIAFVVAAGFVHVTHGSTISTTVCAKDGWSLQGTFANVDDYVGKKLKPGQMKVIDALVSCGILNKHESP